MWPAGLSAGLQTSHTCVLGAAVRGHPRFCLTPRRNFCTPRCGGAVQSCPEQCRGHSWQRRKRWAQRCHSTTLPLDEVPFCQYELWDSIGKVCNSAPADTGVVCSTGSATPTPQQHCCARLPPQHQWQRSRRVCRFTRNSEAVCPVKRRFDSEYSVLQARGLRARAGPAVRPLQENGAHLPSVKPDSPLDCSHDYHTAEWSERVQCCLQALPADL